MKTQIYSILRKILIMLYFFNCNEMSILNIDLNKINLDNNFDDDDPDTIILIRLLAWYIRFENRNIWHGILIDGEIGACQKM